MDELIEMPDREKVIKGLEECAGNGNCMKCQYGKEKQALSCKKLLVDALELLKEQEAVEPTLIREAWNKYYNYYVCPHCRNEVVYEQHYCSECGVKFIWEGR